ncbi:hypothetical protein KP509_11G036100 [Ceratopteris richardii]|uniref:Uncharacterized protein n=1 Tax=Ceratopteris richardii TaxID=49495 RepID=A0A8T2TUD0_CERRI|nr:hypothetical protein KP509_11G036100 [Ceratopteris richardii]
MSIVAVFHFSSNRSLLSSSDISTIPKRSLASKLCLCLVGASSYAFYSTRTTLDLRLYYTLEIVLSINHVYYTLEIVLSINSFLIRLIASWNWSKAEGTVMDMIGMCIN